MKLLVGIIWALAGLHDLFAQAPYTLIYGSCTEQELAQRHFKNDSQAEALIILDKAKTSFVPEGTGFKRVFERKAKLKIFRKSGFKWAQVAIPCFKDANNFEIVSEISGATYNLEGHEVTKTLLDKSTVYEDVYENGWKLLKFAMPDVREGSVIEFSYTLESSFLLSLPSWEFQQNIPVINSEYTLRTVPFYKYSYLLHSGRAYDYFSSIEEAQTQHTFGGQGYNEKVIVFGMNNIPAFKAEAYVASYRDYMIRLDFQLSEIKRINGGTEKLMRTWSQLISTLDTYVNFGEYTRRSEKAARSLVKHLKYKGLTPYECAIEVDNYIKANYNWTGHFNKYADKTPRDFIKTKVGNTASINLLYVALLNTLGIKAYPLLLSTRGNGKIDHASPMIDFFNYVAVRAYVNGQWLTLDATDAWCSFAQLPVHCLNDSGLVVNTASQVAEWVDLKVNHPTKIIYTYDLYVSKSGDSAQVGIKALSSSYDALEWRKSAMTATQRGLERVLPIHHLYVKDSTIVLRHRHEPYEIRFIATEALTMIGGKILVSPFLDMISQENPFKLSERTLPIDLAYKRHRAFEAIVHIPDNYVLLNTPKPYTYKDDGLEISYDVQRVDRQTLKIIAAYTFLKELYPATYYATLSNSFDAMIAAFTQKIVIMSRE